MLRKVKITGLPKAAKGGPRVNPAMGFNANTLNWPAMPGQMSDKPIMVKKSIGPTKGKPDLEAEKGETIVADYMNGGIPQQYIIGGKRHSQGGTNLSVPKNSPAFIFSDTPALKIKDEEVLAMFNKKLKNGGLTPAEIAKQYNINDYYAMLLDPDSDDLQRKTAEAMIAKYNLKLGGLALYQESMKGFKEGGIPPISQSYVEMTGIDPQSIMPPEPTQAQQENPYGDMAKYGKSINKFIPQARRGNRGDNPLLQALNNLMPGRTADPFPMFGNRRQPVGYRFNPQANIIEVVNSNGEVIGYGTRSNQKYRDPYSGWDGTGSMPFITSSNAPQEWKDRNGFGDNSSTSTQTTTTTTKKKKVKKQVVPADAQIIKRSDYATDAEYEAARDKAFADAGGKKTIYTQDKNGRYYTVEEKDYAGSNADENIEMIKGAFKNPKVAEEFKANILKSFDQKNAKGKSVVSHAGLKKEDVEKMTADELADQFIEFNTRNIKGIEQLSKDLGIKPGDMSQGSVLKFFNNKSGKKVENCAFDAQGNRNSKEDQQRCANLKYTSLEDLYEKTGTPMPKDDKSKALQQLTYIGYNNLLKARDNKEIKDDEINKSLSPFIIGQKGVGDEKIAGKYAGSISDADAVYTNTTAGEYAAITGKKRNEKELGETETEEDETTTDVNNVNTDANMPYGFGYKPKKEYFRQDENRMAFDLGNLLTARKYMPWQASLNPSLIKNEYYSPERELAANAEQSNIMANVLAGFTGRKKFSSAASQLSGAGAKNAADILGRYNNLNVGVANRSAEQNADILNRFNMLNADLATKLFDKNTIGNQQYRNAKIAYGDNFVTSLNNAITNASNAYNLNQMNPQFNISPRRGGDMFFTGVPKPWNRTGYTTEDLTTAFNTAKGKLPGVKDEVIWNIVKNQKGIGTEAPDMSFLSQANNVISNSGV